MKIHYKFIESGYAHCVGIKDMNKARRATATTDKNRVDCIKCLHRINQLRFIELNSTSIL